jgi:hypothetical protein
MTPTVIEDYEVPEGAVRHVIGPPDGDPTGVIRPVEAMIFAHEELEVPIFFVKIALDPGDIEKLKEKGHFWLSLIGHQMQPFDVFVK